MERIFILISLFTSILVTYFSCNKIIPFLKRLKCKQTIREIGPIWHQSKSGTPTMGGLTFILGITVASIIGHVLCMLRENANLVVGKAHVSWTNLLCSLFLAFGFGFIGFMDDYVKITKKQNLGLKAREKFVLQFIVSAAYLLQFKLTNGYSSMLNIPFIGQINVGWLIYPIYLFVILGCVNAVNITDGIDGLASSVTCVVACSFVAVALLFGNNYAAILAISLAGGCIGFLYWNFNPAKIIMGDTGSLFIGGFIAAIAFLLNIPVALIFFGIVYVIETLSVIIQMAYYHFTKKRIFKMSPIHHHLELSGHSEIKINVIFMIVSFLGSILGIWSVVIT